MNTYTVETPTLDTLTDFFALHSDEQDRAKRLPILRENIAAGRIQLENVLILRSGRGVEGTALIPVAPQVPVFPRFRPDTTPEGVTALARALRDRAEPERRLLLQDDLAPLKAAPVEEAGWVLDEEHVMYETDLRARASAPDPQAREVTPEEPAVRTLLETLGRAEFELREGWHLIALPDGAGQPLALGAYGPSGRPEWASLDQIGVHPSARGQGYGTRLHAHLLARAAEQFTMHGGGTEAENHAMRRIFARNGSRHVATQMYFWPA